MVDGRWSMIDKDPRSLAKLIFCLMTNYQNLDAWNIGISLVSEIYEITSAFPKEELFGLVSQMRRAAISVPCNIAEGVGRQSKKDTIHFLHIARGSIYETQTLAHISKLNGYITKESTTSLSILIERSLQVTNGLINYYRNSKLR